MNDPIKHCAGVESRRIRTSRQDVHLLTSGPEHGRPVLFLHGNLSSSTFWEETILGLPEQFRAVAPDQRGYGLSDPAARIDARRGFGDWADDVEALADALGWDRFDLVAHSLGGCVAWATIGQCPQRLDSVVLVAPGPPFGFGGAHGETGELNHPDGAGSGAGLVNTELVHRLRQGERAISHPYFSPRAVMNRLYWKPPFRPARDEELLTAMLQIHLGEQQFPGDSISSPNWPGFAPGRFGPINAMSPRYNGGVLERLSAARPKPPLLWVQGSDDAIISDNSVSDAGTQGKIGLLPGWPGNQMFPPQPYLRQVIHALDQYEQTGGRVRRLILPNVGHTPFLESPDEFQIALRSHLQNESNGQPLHALPDTRPNGH
jgi:pimeloyl-ACP methyl ester carboxylesterase